MVNHCSTHHSSLPGTCLSRLRRGAGGNRLLRGGFGKPQARSSRSLEVPPDRRCEETPVTILLGRDLSFLHRLQHVATLVLDDYLLIGAQYEATRGLVG